MVQHLRAMLRQLPGAARPRFPLNVWLALVDYCLNDGAAVRSEPDSGQVLDEVAFAQLVAPTGPLILEWLECARDLHGYAVNGWPERWDSVDE